MSEAFCKRGDERWRVLEFYSGIGGMRYSLIQSGVDATVVEAFDINDKANDVYQHNFGHRPYQGNIQSLTAEDLDQYQAHAWLLSPPCQPYTRQGLQKQSADSRAFSFLKILELIPQISRPPMMLFVENVVGFEMSDTRAKLVEILAKSSFVTQEFILSSLQFGVPYSRPRYFCLAKRMPLSFQCQLFNNHLCWSAKPLFGTDDDEMVNDQNQSLVNFDELLQSCQPIESFLEFRTPCHPLDNGSSCIETSNASEDSFEDPEEICDGQRFEFSSVDQYAVPLSLIERWGSAMDIVYPDSKRCCCFTKSYYRYVKGTGSLLATIEPKNRGKSSPLKEQGLRYFTPREVANLHSYPEEFQFPRHITLRQRYALLGNSLSIAVVAPLLKYLFAEPS